MFLPTQRHELPDHFLAFANPTRLRILQRLGEVGEENVNDLALHLRMSQPRISWHLRMLRAASSVPGVTGARSTAPLTWTTSPVSGGN